MTRRISTLDAHVGGQPLRLVTAGMPTPQGKTIAQKIDWLKRRGDDVRRAVVLEPRGHSDLTAAVFTEPVSPGAHAGLIFMDAEDYPSMSGHGVIAAATLAIERRLVSVPHDGSAEVRLAFDTLAGTITARLHLTGNGSDPRVDSVAYVSPPSFVLEGGRLVHVGSRTLRVDVAFGGQFFALVDTEAIGLPLDGPHVPDLRRLGIDIRDAVNSAGSIQHPADATATTIAGVIFTGPSVDPEAHLRNLTISGAGADRSASGTGTAAIMAVLDAMGVLPDDNTFVNESLTGALLRGRVHRRTVVGDTPALVVEIEGSAWMTGEHAFYLDDDDPLREGFIF